MGGDGIFWSNGEGGWERQVSQCKLLGALPLMAFRYEILKKPLRSGEAVYVLKGEAEQNSLYSSLLEELLPRHETWPARFLLLGLPKKG